MAQIQPAAWTNLTKQGAFDADIENALNTEMTSLATVVAANALDAMSTTPVGNQTMVGNLVVTGTVVSAPNPQVLNGTTDAVTFTKAINVALFTSTGPDAATLATPVSADQGKILILVNNNTTQNTVTTAAGIIINGAASGHILTAPAVAGSVAMLIATPGLKWAAAVLGAGTWVLT